jgi:hypothetical protein
MLVAFDIILNYYTKHIQNIYKTYTKHIQNIYNHLFTF